jgi:5,10-methenyltetrahydromethanopterin hydrogenase
MSAELIHLLRRRETVIADHAWRDRDPSGHLDALKAVSAGIDAWVQANHKDIDPRLRHYLGNASFAKALAHLEAAPGE